MTSAERSPRVVVVGTGTDVGKTHVTACLLRAARARGVRLVGYKPIASGVSNGVCDDTRAHALAAGEPEIAPTYALTRPVSPHLAAREEGVSIDLERIAARVAELEARADGVLVETAGGLFSPIDARRTNVDLCKRLAPCRVLLVASDRLGVLHDVRACTQAAAASRIAIDVVVLSAPPAPDGSSGGNAEELERLGIARVAAVFPRAPFDAARSLEAAERTLEAARR